MFFIAFNKLSFSFGVPIVIRRQPRHFCTLLRLRTTIPFFTSHYTWHPLGDIHQQEISVRRIYLIGERRLGQDLLQPVTLREDLVHLVLHGRLVAQELQSFLLRKLVDVIRIFDLIQDTDNLRRGQMPYPNESPARSPRFRQG